MCVQGEQLSIQWAKQSGLLPEGRATQDGAGLLIITQVGKSTDSSVVMLMLISKTPRCKRLTLEHTCAQQLLDSLLSRKGKNWWWVAGHTTGEMEVETTVEDHMVEDHSEPPWSSHLKT